MGSPLPIASHQGSFQKKISTYGAMQRITQGGRLLSVFSGLTNDAKISGIFKSV